MNKFFVIQKDYKSYFLFVFPVFYFFSGILFRLVLGDPSLRSVDPEFVYFMTGLNISEGYFKVIHIDHPGTPLQYLVAVVFRITHFLRGNSTQYAEDVLKHPDLYLSMVNIVTTIIVAITLIIAGFYVFKKTRSLIYGILIQTAPLITTILYEIIGRVTPEILVPIPIIALTAFLIGHLADKKERFDVRGILFISFLMGFGLSIKLTLLPIWIIPLIIMGNWKDRLLSISLSVIFFLIIALPVTLQIDKFWHWTKDLFLHSGQYGSGEENILNIKKLKENITLIFGLQKHFSYLLVFYILTIIPTYFFVIKKQENPILKRMLIFSVAIVTAVLLQIIISGKHYAPRYFLPALLFGPILIILVAEIIKGIWPSKIIRYLLDLILVLFMIWSFKQQIGTINYTSQAFEQQIAAKSETRNFTEYLNKESIKIVATIDFNCPYPESALLYSTIWSVQSLKNEYIPLLQKMYPNTYQYTLWGDNLHYWGESLDPENIIMEEKPVYLLLENDNPELYNKVIGKIFTDYVVEKTKIFENPVTKEQVFRLFVNQKPINAL